VNINEVAMLFPMHYSDLETKLKQQRKIEMQDEMYAYFLNVKDMLFAGDNLPYERAVPNIKVMLMNQKRLDFLRKMEDDLYEIAEKKGLIGGEWEFRTKN
jgi:hypothetical protein